MSCALSGTAVGCTEVVRCLGCKYKRSLTRSSASSPCTPGYQALRLDPSTDAQEVLQRSRMISHGLEPPTGRWNGVGRKEPAHAGFLSPVDRCQARSGRAARDSLKTPHTASPADRTDLFSGGCIHSASGNVYTLAPGRITSKHSRQNVREHVCGCESGGILLCKTCMTLSRICAHWPTS